MEFIFLRIFLVINDLKILVHFYTNNFGEILYLTT